MPFLKPLADKSIAMVGSLMAQSGAVLERSAARAPNGLVVRGCERPGCRSGSMRAGLGSPRQLSCFEGSFLCSRDCLQRAVAAALRRELAGADQAEAPYSHRIPLGLLMLSRQWITRDQLAGALAQQRAAGGKGRLGEWLIRTQGVEEQLVAKALAVQWNAPLLSLDAHHDLRTAALLPQLFVQVFGAIPLRIAARKILYLAVNDRVDRSLNAALEAMTGLTVEAGVVNPSDYSELQEAALRHAAPVAKVFSRPSPEGLEHSITALIAEGGAISSRLVRVRGYLWVRIEKLSGEPSAAAHRQTEDAIFSLREHVPAPCQSLSSGAEGTQGPANL